MEQSPPPQYAQYPRPGSGPGSGGEFPHRGPGVYFEQIGEAFKLMFRNPKVYLGGGGIALGLFAVWYLVMVVGVLLMSPKGNSRMEDPSAFLSLMGLVYGSELIVIWLVNIVCAGMIACAVEDLSGKTSSFSTLFSGFRRFTSLTVTTFLCSLLTFVGTIFCFVPGLYVAGVLALAPAITLIERLGPIESMQKSFELLKPFGWMMALMMFVLYMIVGAGSMLCGIGLLFTLPVFYIMSGFHYRDFCIPVQRQMHVPGPGGPGPSGPGPTVGPGGFQMPG